MTAIIPVTWPVVGVLLVSPENVLCIEDRHDDLTQIELRNGERFVSSLDYAALRAALGVQQERVS